MDFYDLLTNFKFVTLIFIFSFKQSVAQDNFVIEIHGTQPNLKHDIIPQLHCAYVLSGSKKSVDGVVPSEHLFYSALETSHWFTEWFESSLVFYSAVGDSNRTDYVGTHFHQLFLLSKKYKLPGNIGLGLVADLGFQKRKYFTDNTTLELAPVIDKRIKNIYLSLNTSFVRSLKGLNAKNGFSFSPALKLNYLLGRSHLALGIEFYASTGTLNTILPIQQQQQQLFFVLDLYNYQRLNFNFGYGIGLTQSTDRSIMKMMIGWKFHDKLKI